MTNAKPTQGPCKYDGDGFDSVAAQDCGTDGYTVMDDDCFPICQIDDRINDGEAEANAEFITEAFNVLHETGLTPRQLQQQRNELLEALNWIAGVANINYQQDRKLRSDSARTLARIIKKADAAIAAAKAGAS